MLVGRDAMEQRLDWGLGGSSLGCKVDSAKGSTEALGGAKGRGWGGERTAKRVEWLRREMRGE